MGKRYGYLQAEERATVMLMRSTGSSLRSIARALGRAPSTIGRELARNTAIGASCDTARSGQRALVQRRKRRRVPKLGRHTVLFGVVEHFLPEGWSPQQIAGRLKRMAPDEPDRRVSHETLYNALYVMPRGELHHERIASACAKVAPGAGRARAAPSGAGRCPAWWRPTCARPRSRIG